VSRRAKPFIHQGHYYTSIGGKQRRFCPVEDGLEQAEEELRKLQSERFQTGRIAPELTVAEAAALFLRQVETDKGSTQKTFQWYKRNLQRLVGKLGNRKLRSLKPQDGVEYKRYLLDEANLKPTGRRPGQKFGKIKGPRSLGSTSINHHLRAAKTLLNWAVESDLLVKNPWRGKKRLQLLPEKGRERVVNDEEFKALLQHCADDFRDVLLVLRYTAARPEDIRHLTWPMVAFETHCWVIPPSQHKTGNTQKERKPRIIPMIPLVSELLTRLRGDKTEGYVFTTQDGRPWNGAGLSLKFRRLRERAGIDFKDGEHLVLYSTRHTRLTELAPELADRETLQMLNPLLARLVESTNRSK
jgi:integrase